MFTGIIEETGKIETISRRTESGVLSVACEKVLEDTKMGDSIAVNGICLTVTKLTKQEFTADVMPETMHRSSLNQLSPGDKVNLERAMAADGRFGGHIVSGHIDGTGRIQKVDVQENAVWYTVLANEKLLHYIVEKGSVALDGISLTVAEIKQEYFKVSVIPHTRQETNLGTKKAGDMVNIECDIIGKYIEKLLAKEQGTSKTERITEDFLKKHGF